MWSVPINIQTLQQQNLNDNNFLMMIRGATGYLRQKKNYELNNLYKILFEWVKMKYKLI